MGAHSSQFHVPASEKIAPSGSQDLCVVGEALIDFLPRETKDGDPAYMPKAGGAPFNVCIAARRLGLPVHFFSGISKDLFGEDLFNHLGREKVDLSLVRRVDKPTTLAFVSRTAGADVKYAFFKENAADRSLTREDSVAAMEGRSFGAVHMSLGAVTFEDQQMLETFAELFCGAQRKGAFTSFDPNIREPMIAGGAEAYRDKVEEFMGIVDLAKSSDADIEFMYGKGAKLDEVAEKWLALGVRLVVITKGPEGAVAFYRQVGSETAVSVSVLPPTKQPNTIDASGKAAPVSDTVGAGDTCMGGLLFGLLGGDGAASLAPQLAAGEAWDDTAAARLTEILQHSVAAAAINCSRPGCDPPTSEEVKVARAALASA